LGNPHVEYLAHHWILLAGPAFLPAVIVVGVVLYVAIRDRRRAGDDAERSDAEKRRLSTAGDDAERSDAEKRRLSTAGDDAERSDAEKRRLRSVGQDDNRD
jgi:hypothetical protein